MITTYKDFVTVCQSKCSLFEQVSPEHLNYRGLQAHNLYKAVLFNCAFAANAHELLELIRDDGDMEIIAGAVPVEYKQIVRCLERLSDVGATTAGCGKRLVPQGLE